jgi:hypothetical protein
VRCHGSGLSVQAAVCCTAFSSQYFSIPKKKEMWYNNVMKEIAHEICRSICIKLRRFGHI